MMVTLSMVMVEVQPVLLKQAINDLVVKMVKLPMFAPLYVETACSTPMKNVMMKMPPMVMVAVKIELLKIIITDTEALQQTQALA